MVRRWSSRTELRASEHPERIHRYETAVSDSARWDAYRPRAGDVIVTTAPKCGTTWTQMLCALLIHGPELPAPLTRMSPWLDRLPTPLGSVVAEIEAQPWRRIMKTHTPLDGLPWSADVSYVFCGRDPRDAFLSMVDNLRNTSEAMKAEVAGRIGVPWGFDLPSDPNCLFRTWMTVPTHAWVDDGFPTGSVFGAARAVWPWRRLPNIHLVHYRDLTRDLEGEARRLARFLGLNFDEGAWPALAAAAGLAAMRERAHETAPGAHLGDWSDNRAFFAQGRLDAWRSVLNPESQELYESLAPSRAPPTLLAWLEGGRAALGTSGQL